MKLIFHITVFLWVALSVLMGLYTALLREREDLAYRQIFFWLMSPFIAIAGLVFIDRNRKKDYFHRLMGDLFIKK